MNRRIIRLLSIMLVLVMSFSLVTPAYAIDGTDSTEDGAAVTEIAGDDVLMNDDPGEDAFAEGGLDAGDPDAGDPGEDDAGGADPGDGSGQDPADPAEDSASTQTAFLLVTIGGPALLWTSLSSTVQVFSVLSFLTSGR